MKNERMDFVLQYIDTHLQEPMTALELSKLAGYSFYHFCHLFAVYTGCPVAAYIRGKRLSHAANDLLAGKSCTETAYRWGFDTPTGFSRAFRGQYGITPIQFKKTGGNRMNYELKHMDVLHAVCYKFAPEGEFNFHDSSAYWYGKDFSTVSKAEYQEIAAHSNAEIGIWLDPDAVTGEFFYFFGPIVPEGVNRIPAGMEKIEIPEADYAVFSVPPAQDADVLHANIQKVWEDIFEWFHTDDEYKATSKKCIFEYYSGDTTAIYVPVVRAK